MITCQVYGGLGNQLFQIFATISYAIKYKMNFLFLYESVHQTRTRPGYWDTFLKRLKVFTTNNLPPLQLNIREKGFNYTDLYIPKEPLNICLDGYFQSYKYFKDNEDIIFKVIMVDHIKKEILSQEGISKTYFDNSASIHFRLGDYKKLPEYHPIIPYEYYSKSISLLKSEGKQINKIFYFCENEDHDHVLREINKLRIEFPEIVFVREFEGLSDWQQMIIMSLCENNIIANSTFSWWGAYFNKNPGRRVCYPSIWFGPRLAGHNTTDLFPPTWNKIML